MKTIMAIVAMVFMSGVSIAQVGTGTIPVCPPCPSVEVICKSEPVTVTCKSEPVSVTCGGENGGMVTLPGLWEVWVLGKKRCGEITVVGSGFIINDELMPFNKPKIIKAVEGCE